MERIKVVARYTNGKIMKGYTLDFFPNKDRPHLIGELEVTENLMVKQKLGRNDPCWCGSGRKLKKCHGTAERYQPKQATFHVPESRRPKPIVTHLEKHKDEWVERPGLLAVRLVTGDPGDVDVELAALRSRWGNLLQSHSVPYRVSQAVTSRLNDIQHKLRGVRYHRENFDRHETDMELQFSTAAPPTGAEMQQKAPGLVFEVEGFLYQTKSALDMLAQVLRDAGFQSVGESFGRPRGAYSRATTGPSEVL